MNADLKLAARVICDRLRNRPYQRGVSISAWDAIVDQCLDGRRYGAFSWQNAVFGEVDRYLNEMSAEAKQRVWDTT